ncbi:MAG: DUF2721 domain-containing protein [Acidobacteria bacterium]|nr:DUF2721 domain-containing protein [Acidobacteriota bacterium]
MDSFAQSPFAALTIIGAPAILTNASALLCLVTSNRLARIVDRTRVLASELGRIDLASSMASTYEQHLGKLKVRAQLLMRALRLFTMSIGSFAAAALISVVGTLLAARANDVIWESTAALSLVSGTAGVAGLVFGSGIVVRETHLAVQFLEQEIEFLQVRERPH